MEVQCDLKMDCNDQSLPFHFNKLCHKSDHYFRPLSSSAWWAVAVQFLAVLIDLLHRIAAYAFPPCPQRKKGDEEEFGREHKQCIKNLLTFPHRLTIFAVL